MVRLRSLTAVVSPKRFVTPTTETSPLPWDMELLRTHAGGRTPALDEGDRAKRHDDDDERHDRGHRSDGVEGRRGDVGGHRPDLERQGVLRTGGQCGAGDLVVGQGEAEQGD